MTIKTSFVFPPIEDRSMDWNAVDADTYEGGSPMGFGKTEQEAVDDLLDQLGVTVADRFVSEVNRRVVRGQELTRILLKNLFGDHRAAGSVGGDRIKQPGCGLNEFQQST